MVKEYSQSDRRRSPHRRGRLRARTRPRKPGNRQPPKSPVRRRWYRANPYPSPCSTRRKRSRSRASAAVPPFSPVTPSSAIDWVILPQSFELSPYESAHLIPDPSTVLDATAIAFGTDDRHLGIGLRDWLTPGFEGRISRRLAFLGRISSRPRPLRPLKSIAADVNPPDSDRPRAIARGGRLFTGLPVHLGVSSVTFSCIARIARAGGELPNRSTCCESWPTRATFSWIGARSGRVPVWSSLRPRA